MELAIDRQDPEAARAAGASGSPRGPSREMLRVADIMSRDVITATLDDTILSVARKMSELRVSCVIVMDRGRVVGILTEKDLLDSVAGRDTEFHRLKVAERMSSPVDTIPAHLSVFEADRMMDVKCIRRLPVVEEGQLVGIVTQTDITRGLISLNSLRYVSDVMTRYVASVRSDATVVEAARLMSTSNISCLIAMDGQDVTGIITEGPGADARGGCHVPAGGGGPAPLLHPHRQQEDGGHALPPSARHDRQDGVRDHHADGYHAGDSQCLRRGGIPAARAGDRVG
jgi:CBS domain-containing protein